MDEGFVDGILFEMRRELSQNGHDTIGHVRIQFIVAGDENKAERLLQVFDFEVRSADGDVEFFEFRRTGHDAAVVVRQDGDAPSFEARIEDAFAGNIEIIAIN